MAITPIDIWNRALSAAKISGRVVSATENTKQANACALWYESTRKMLLQSAPWSFATQYNELARLSITSPSNWLYVYSLPNGMLAPRYLTTGMRFEMASTSDQEILYTNDASPTLVATMDREQPAIWSPMFNEALVAYLGSRVARELNAKISVARELFDEANTLIMEARAADGNESEELYGDPAPPAVSMRGFSGPGDMTNFYRVAYLNLEPVA